MGMGAFDEAGLLRLFFVFAGLEQIVFEEVLCVEQPAQLLHESDLLFTQLQNLLSDIVLQCEQPRGFDLKCRGCGH